MNQTILVVEQKPSIRYLLNDSFLNEPNIIVRAVDSGQNAIKQVKDHSPQVVLIDTNTRDIQSVSLCKEIRHLEVGVRIIVVSDDNSNVSITEHLDNGADDYVSRPFDVDELKARIHARLRYLGDNEDKIINCANITLDQDMMEVRIGGNKVEFSAKEYELLKLFMLNKNHILSRDKILNTVWGYLYDVETRAVDMQISKIRKKLLENQSKSNIESIRGFGYRMSENLCDKL